MLRLVLLLSLLTALAARADTPDHGPNLERFPYPFQVHRFSFQSQLQPLEMAYMDVPADPANGPTALLLHGKNFCAATWEETIRALTKAGWRAVAPDQIGFCKSSKPEAYQYGLHQLAANTRTLAGQIRAGKAVLIGHSMGGMLAIRYALMYPDAVAALVLVNPIGLEDWRAEGVRALTFDEWYKREQRTSFDTIKAYQQRTYYAGEWHAEYDRWVSMLAGMYAGEGRDQVARAQARTSDMILNQPIVYELERIRVPTVLMIGERDTTAIARDAAPAEVAEKLGRYAELGAKAAERIPGARLITFPELGHAPQIQDPERFNAALLDALGALRQR